MQQDQMIMHQDQRINELENQLSQLMGDAVDICINWELVE